jgi:hypothetical protein
LFAVSQAAPLVEAQILNSYEYCFVAMLEKAAGPAGRSTVVLRRRFGPVQTRFGRLFDVIAEV